MAERDEAAMRAIPKQKVTREMWHAEMSDLVRAILDCRDLARQQSLADAFLEGVRQGLKPGVTLGQYIDLLPERFTQQLALYMNNVLVLAQAAKG